MCAFVYKRARERERRRERKRERKRERFVYNTFLLNNLFIVLTQETTSYISRKIQMNRERERDKDRER